MAIRVVRLGTPRLRDEGLRLGTVRRPPRGVRKHDHSARDYYDVWLPELAPSAGVLAAALATPWNDTRWRHFSRTYQREMRAPHARHLIETLAALSHQTNFSIGCYCEHAERCHRVLLRDLFIAADAHVVP